MKCNVNSLGYRSQKSIHFGAFPSRLHPPLCLIPFEFLVTPPTSYIFNLLYEMMGDLPLYIMFGEASKSPHKVARQKKIDKFQTQSLSYILSCLVGCLGDQLNTIKYCMILMILQYKNRALDRALWWSPPCKNLALDRARWCSPPCKNRALNRAVLVFPCVPLRAKIVL